MAFIEFTTGDRVHRVELTTDEAIGLVANLYAIRNTKIQTDDTERMAYVALKGSGWTYDEIADHFHVSRWTVARWVERYRKGWRPGETANGHRRYRDC